MLIQFDTLTLYGLLILHLIFSLAVMAAAVFVLKKRYPRQKSIVAAFFFIFSFSLPLLGVPLSLWLILFFKNYQYSDHDIEYKTINTDPFFVEFPLVHRQFGDSAIREMMENEQVPLIKRMTALTMLSERKSRENMEIIKQMLSSQNDELRLLSFAAIDSVEEEIHKKIHDEKLLLEKKKSRLAQLHIIRSLAHSYWELVYFGLADEVLKNFLLEKVEDYVNQVLEYFPEDTKALILLGKVCFERKEDAKAEEVFFKVLSLYRENNNRNQTEFILPYIAEIYFHQRRFIELKKMIEKSKYFDLVPKLRPIQELWAA